jgi:hypothetical protein
MLFFVGNNFRVADYAGMCLTREILCLERFSCFKSLKLLFIFQQILNLFIFNNPKFKEIK